MKLKKIHIEWDYAPDRLCRDFYVDKDTSLSFLALCIQQMFVMSGDQLYCFNAGDRRYVTRREYDFQKFKDRILDDYALSDLGESFSFEYDYNKPYHSTWKFICTLDSRSFSHDSDERFFLDSGTGAGIFEDGLLDLMGYIDGEISPDMAEDDEENMINMPWNLGLARMGDFDLPLNIQEEQKWIREQLSQGRTGLLAQRWDDYLTALAEYETQFIDEQEVYASFRKTCESLKKTNDLPAEFSELKTQCEETDKIMEILAQDAESATDREEFEAMLEITEYLLDTFKLDDWTQIFVHIYHCTALRGLRWPAEALQEARTLNSSFPDSFPAKAELLVSLDACENYQEADSLVEQTLKQEERCTRENILFYLEAGIYLKKHGNQKAGDYLLGLINTVL